MKVQRTLVGAFGVPLLRQQRTRGRRRVGRKLIVTVIALVAFACIGSTALAAPNGDHASCEAILTSPDAHIQIRDDVAREFAAEDSPPGVIYSSAARATGTTEEECLASLGD
jgi:hypothetical protein